MDYYHMLQRGWITENVELKKPEYIPCDSISITDSDRRQESNYLWGRSGWKEHEAL